MPLSGTSGAGAVTSACATSEEARARAAATATAQRARRRALIESARERGADAGDAPRHMDDRATDVVVRRRIPPRMRRDGDVRRGARPHGADGDDDDQGRAGWQLANRAGDASSGTNAAATIRGGRKQLEPRIDDIDDPDLQSDVRAPIDNTDRVRDPVPGRHVRAASHRLAQDEVRTRSRRGSDAVPRESRASSCSPDLVARDVDRPRHGLGPRDVPDRESETYDAGPEDCRLASVDRGRPDEVA